MLIHIFNTAVILSLTEPVFSIPFFKRNFSLFDPTKIFIFQILRSITDDMRLFKWYIKEKRLIFISLFQPVNRFVSNYSCRIAFDYSTGFSILPEVIWVFM